MSEKKEPLRVVPVLSFELMCKLDNKSLESWTAFVYAKWKLCQLTLLKEFLRQFLVHLQQLIE